MIESLQHSEDYKVVMARHSLLRLPQILKMAPPELIIQLRDHPIVAGGQVWIVGRMRDNLDAHLGQVVGHQNGLVAGCIVPVQEPLARLKEFWPLARKSVP